MKENIVPLKWENDRLLLLDQRVLPLEEQYVNVGDIAQCHNAIQTMVVRGAPLIGLSAIWGMVLWLKDNITNEKIDEAWLATYEEAGAYLKTARPTAVNLEFEIDRCLHLAKDHMEDGGTKATLYEKTVDFSRRQMEELRKMNLSMAKMAEAELKNKFGDRKLRLMTLCNTGVLACGPMGTALGVISYLAELDKIEKVWASETRPYMQGIRLTSYELVKQGINHDIVVEGAASYLMDQGKVDAIFVGADRIVSNGDTANKIGTSTLSIVAKNYSVPFYVVAPTSSFDLSKENGNEIEIELRDPEEILVCQGQRLAPYEASALNPSFDITRSNFISGIFCENGFINPVCKENVVNVVSSV